jgi:hypothetical protein
MIGSILYSTFIGIPAYLYEGLKSLSMSEWVGPIFEPFLEILSPIGQALGEVGSAMSDVFSSLWQLATPFYELFNSIYSSLGEAVYSIGEAFQPLFGIFGSIGTAISDLFSWIGGLFSPITNMFSSSADSAGSAFSAMNMLKGLIYGVSYAIGSLIKIALIPLQIAIGMVALVIKPLAWAIKTVANVISSVASGIKALFSGDIGISDVASLLMNGLKSVFIDFPSWLLSTITSGLSSLGSTIVSGIGSALKSVFVDFPTWLYDQFTGALSKVWDYIKSWIPGMKQAENVAVGYSETAAQQSATMAEKGSSTSHALGSLAGAGADLLELDLSEAASKTGLALKEGAIAAAENIKNGAEAAWEGVKAAGSYLNPLSYFPSYDVGANKIERSGLAVVHEGEMVVPASFTDKVSAESSGPFGNKRRPTEVTNEEVSSGITRYGPNNALKDLEKSIAIAIRDSLVEIEIAKKSGNESDLMDADDKFDNAMTLAVHHNIIRAPKDSEGEEILSFDSDTPEAISSAEKYLNKFIKNVPSNQNINSTAITKTKKSENPLDEYLTLSPEDYAAGNRFSEKGWMDMGAAGLVATHDADAALAQFLREEIRWRHSCPPVTCDHAGISA